MIRILHLEDSTRDAELVRAQLDAGGMECEIDHVRNRLAFEAALAEGRYDLLLLDFHLPGFGGLEALRHARGLRPSPPVIFVSGILDDEEAVECVKAGAADYVLKDRMRRLPAAIQAALKSSAEGRLRSEAQQALRESEQRLSLALESSDLAVWEWHVPSGAVSFTGHWWPILGFAPGDVPLRVEAWEALAHADDRRRIRAAISAHFRQAAPRIDVEYRMRDQDGSLRWIRSVGRVVERDASGRPVRAIGTHGDVTLRRQREEKLARLTRIDRLRARVNALIVRAGDRLQLLEEACDIIVDTGGYVMAWVGFVDEATQRVKPVAKAGREEGYLDAIQPSANPDAPGHGMVGQSVRNKLPAVRLDFTAPGNSVNAVAALERGYRSGVALPLVVDGAVRGALAIYAGQAGAFDQEEVSLLDEFAGDIAFALDHIDKGQRLDYLTSFDSLTGLANRRLFMERCDRFLEAAGPRSMVAVMLLDLDGFRHVNETLGRHGGDELLRRMAGRLSDAFANLGSVARIDADCFAVTVPEVASGGEAARHLRDRVWPAIGRPLEFNDREYRLAARAGITLAPTDGSDAATLLKNAESALNRAKASGEPYRFYEVDVHRRIAARFTMESELRQALEEQCFALHYQPKFDARSRTITGLEALIRWTHRERGLVGPDEFIRVLEETGLVQEVGQWVLREVAADHRRWVLAGMAPPPIAVNVSALELRHPEFCGRVGKALSAMRDVDPRHAGLDIEITESVAMENVEAQIAFLARIRDLGVRVFLDDFGTGFSSLQYIARLPIDAMKIDRSFVKAMNSRPEDLSIVSTVISLAHALRLTVVAEGVENAEQHRMLELLRCDEVQGFHWGRPVPAAEIPRLLAAARRNKE